MKRHHAMVTFLVASTFYGFTPLFINLAYDSGFKLNEVIGVQVMIALAVLWTIGIFALRFHRNVIKQLNVRTVLSLIGAGSFAGLTSILYYGSMQYLPASLSVVLLFQFVWIGVLFEWIVDRKKPSFRTMLTVLLTMVGVVFAADTFNGGLSQISLLGFVLGIGSAFSYTGFIIVSGRVAVDIPATLRTPLMTTGSALLIFIIFPPHQSLDVQLLSNADIWLYAGGLALSAMILTPLLFAMSAPSLSPGLATILGSIELPVSVLVSYIGLAEYISFSRWFGVLLIIVAIGIGEIQGFRQMFRTQNRVIYQQKTSEK